MTLSAFGLGQTFVCLRQFADEQLGVIATFGGSDFDREGCHGYFLSGVLYVDHMRLRPAKRGQRKIVRTFTGRLLMSMTLLFLYEYRSAKPMSI